MGRGLTSSGAGFGVGFAGGLITGVREVSDGGGSTISLSPVCGGLNTLGSSVGVAGGGLAGVSVSGLAVPGGAAQADGEVVGSQAGGEDAAHATMLTATVMTAALAAALSVVRMAHLINV